MLAGRWRAAVKGGWEAAAEAVPLAFASYQPAEPGAAARPIVVSHGLLGSKSNWQTVARHLVQRTKRRVVAVDARNHGESPKTDEFSYEAMSADLGALLGLVAAGGRASLVGHSMGGKTSMLQALARPEGVESLVVVDVSPVKEAPSLDAVKKLIDAMSAVRWSGSERTLSEARSVAEEGLKAAGVDSGRVRRFLLTNVVETEGGGGWGWRLNLAALSANLGRVAAFPAPKGRLYAGPTLFVAGSESDYIRPEHAPEIKRLFPRAEVKVVEGAGHMVHVEKPKEFLDIAVDFLNRSAPRGDTDKNKK